MLYASWPFAARFSNCSNSLNFEAKINFNTTRQNDLKWRKTCTGLKFDLEHFNAPLAKFIGDSLYKHPVVLTTTIITTSRRYASKHSTNLVIRKQRVKFRDVVPMLKFTMFTCQVSWQFS